MRMAVIWAACLGSLFSAAPPALGAAWNKEAIWEIAALEGRYSAQAELTNTFCERYDADGKVTYFTATGTSSETTTFTATPKARLYMGQRHGEQPMITGASSGKKLYGKFIFDRQTTMDSSEDPDGCKRRRPDDSAPRDCGTRSARFPLLAGTNNPRRWTGLALWYGHPDTGYSDTPEISGLWKNCVMAAGIGGPPLYNSSKDLLRGQASVKTLMGRGRRATVKATRTWTKTLGGGDESFTSRVNHSFTWTMRLRRVSGKVQTCNASGCSTSRY